MEEIEFEIKHLDNKKVGTLMNIPTKQLKQVIDIVVDLLMEIWNVEIVQHKKYPGNLKLAGISPIYKRLVDNIRPVSILPTVSKIFERLMQKLMKDFVKNFLS